MTLLIVGFVVAHWKGLLALYVATVVTFYAVCIANAEEMPEEDYYAS